ncbi:glutamate receptor-like isoform X2 [Macrobrachium nipponense]|uniref:glutamate receptor-like isoform X2 n=1 Tax=Macrobrachium nipponense TaxID=159736 RepID=UPI0030C83077
MKTLRCFLLRITMILLSALSSTQLNNEKRVGAMGRYRWSSEFQNASLATPPGLNGTNYEAGSGRTFPSVKYKGETYRSFSVSQLDKEAKVLVSGTGGDASLYNGVAVSNEDTHHNCRYPRFAVNEIANGSTSNSDRVKLTLNPKLESDAGAKLGNFLIDILTVTGHVDVHLVTKGVIVKGLDTVANMLVSRYIQIELWPNLIKFLSHLGPTEGYLSADQFIVYGSSNDIVNIVVTRRQYMDVINIGITTWYYVVLDNVVSNQKLANTMEEGSISILLRPSLHRAEDWVAYTLISPGDGTRFFQVVGKWTKTSGLKVTKTIFPAESMDFLGRHLIIGVINKPRVLEIKRSGEGSLVEMVGYSNDILKIIQKFLNFTVEPKEYSTWGHVLPDGTWDGVIGDLMQKKIDFSPMDFTPTKESREVYVLMGIVFVSSGCVLWVFIHLNTNLLPGAYPIPKKATLRDVVTLVTKTIVAQAVNHVPEEFSSRIFMIMVWYVALILDMTYQGSITAFIAIPRYTEPIDNLEELSANSSVIPVTEEYSTTYTMIVESGRESFQKLTERLETYDAEFLDSEEFFYGVAVGKWAFVDTHSSTYGRALNFENQRSRCKFFVSRETIIGGFDAWPFPRNSPVHSQISNRIKWMRYYGILEKIKKRYYVSTCDTSRNIDEASKMGLLQLQGVFYVLAIGWTISATFFLLELIYYTIRRCFE